MKLTYAPYSLQFRHPFVLAAGTRTETEVVYVTLEQNGVKGYGEAALPPYLGETAKTVCDFLAKADISKISAEDIPSSFKAIDGAASGNNAAKASIEIALHDLAGKLLNKPVKDMYHIKGNTGPLCTYTIGIGTPQSVKEKLKAADEFKILKIKLGGGNDKEMINALINETDKPFCVDVNQGWKDRHYAIDMIWWLNEKGAILAEQPMPKEMLDETARLTEESPIPIIADEAVKRLEDIERVKGAFSGINVKLMKSCGIYEAYKMIQRAKELEMKILIGCMSESSCGVTAAAHLSPLCDWADLDGPWLIKNDPFTGMILNNGRVEIPPKAGTGAEKRAGFSIAI